MVTPKHLSFLLTEVITDQAAPTAAFPPGWAGRWQGILQWSPKQQKLPSPIRPRQAQVVFPFHAEDVVKLPYIPVCPALPSARPPNHLKQWMPAPHSSPGGCTLSWPQVADARLLCASCGLSAKALPSRFSPSVPAALHAGRIPA